MNNYGRDRLWDAATWAELDEVVADEVKRVSVVRRVFRTESVMDIDGHAPSWVSGAQVETTDKALFIPEGNAKPFVEISVPFRLSAAQVENESTLHTARTLARLAAKVLALAEDALVLRGTDTGKWPARVNGRARIPKVDRIGEDDGIAGGAHTVAVNIKKATARQKPASNFLDGVTAGISDMMGAAWPEPYGLILSTDLYTTAVSQIVASSTETPEDRLASRVRYLLASDALDANSGVLVSLAGDPMILYVGRTPTTVFTGETHHDDDGTLFNFRVLERVRYVIRDPDCVAPVTRAT
jgi:uncharacterized linocin/CFP29 family protein